LQSRKLDSLNPLSEPSNLLLNSGLSLLNPHLLSIRLLANPTLFQIQVQPNRSLRSTDLIPQPGIQLGQVGGDFLVRCAGELGFG
jgi:hypothetical protein